MTEGLQGFGEFTEAIQNLERAAGGGAWSHGTGAGMYRDSNGRWRDPSANPNGTTIHGAATPDPLYNPTSGRHYDPTDEVSQYDEELF